MNLIIEHEISETLFPIEQEKRRNIECKCEQNRHEKTGAQQKTHQLRNTVKGISGSWFYFVGHFKFFVRKLLSIVKHFDSAQCDNAYTNNIF